MRRSARAVPPTARAASGNGGSARRTSLRWRCRRVRHRRRVGGSLRNARRVSRQRADVDRPHPGRACRRRSRRRSERNRRRRRRRRRIEVPRRAPATAPCHASSPSSSALRTRSALRCFAGRATSSLPLPAWRPGDVTSTSIAAQRSFRARRTSCRRGERQPPRASLRRSSRCARSRRPSPSWTRSSRTVTRRSRSRRGDQQAHGIRPYVDDPDPHARDSGRRAGRKRRARRRRSTEISVSGRLRLGVGRVRARCA